MKAACAPPEELLGAGLCVAAVLLAGNRRPVPAGVLLGLAISNKAWALLAIGPVLLALPDRRTLALLVAGGVTAAIMAPLFLFAPHAAQPQGAGASGVIFQPWQVWWPLGSTGEVVRGFDGNIKVGEPARVGSAALRACAGPVARRDDDVLGDLGSSRHW